MEREKVSAHDDDDGRVAIRAAAGAIAVEVTKATRKIWANAYAEWKQAVDAELRAREDWNAAVSTPPGRTFDADKARAARSAWERAAAHVEATEAKRDAAQNVHCAVSLVAGKAARRAATWSR